VLGPATEKEAIMSNTKSAPLTKNPFAYLSLLMLVAALSLAPAHAKTVATDTDAAVMFASIQ
jgi:hypothetical protein